MSFIIQQEQHILINLRLNTAKRLLTIKTALFHTLWKFKPIFKMLLNAPDGHYINHFSTNQQDQLALTLTVLNARCCSINHKCMCNAALLANQIRVLDIWENTSHWAGEERIRWEKSCLWDHRKLLQLSHSVPQDKLELSEWSGSSFIKVSRAQICSRSEFCITSDLLCH